MGDAKGKRCGACRHWRPISHKLNRGDCGLFLEIDSEWHVEYGGDEIQPCKKNWQPKPEAESEPIADILKRKRDAAAKDYTFMGCDMTDGFTYVPPEVSTLLAEFNRPTPGWIAEQLEQETTMTPYEICAFLRETDDEKAEWMVQPSWTLARDKEHAERIALSRVVLNGAEAAESDRLEVLVRPF